MSVKFGNIKVMETLQLVDWLSDTFKEGTFRFCLSVSKLEKLNSGHGMPGKSQ